ncbi:FecR family protein [Algoriphagus aquimarinus]|uniref:FecR family protein n=1 Tax=Algoriphagus aquimarinus TaxID=237018 RepID=A0A5C7ABZ8_9BACT|nr:FecR family protein [Algoriphagus aquimarinus]TXE04795.1 FecR family protein [Algoriphagus aquimarinus]
MSNYTNHKKYEDYEFEDFLSDEFFVQWVKSHSENNLHFWEKWLISNPQKREMVTEAASFVRSIQYKENFEFTDEAYIEVFENILKVDLETPSISSTHSKKEVWYSFFSVRRVAAILLIGFSCWALFETQNFSESEKAPIEWITKVNEAGKKTVIHLNDGTVIHLNSNSKISYPKTFTDSIRVISMEGEAFFDVEKETRPFIVEVNDAKVEVLGTSFNVNSVVEGKLEVALVSGKVKVNDKLGNQVMLDPMEMIVLEDNGKIYKQDFDVRSVTGWKDKYLVFTDDDFDTVVRKIKNWYGVEISTSGKFNTQWAYTGQYFDESLENVLEGIAQTSKIKYKIKGKEVQITH